MKKTHKENNTKVIIPKEIITYLMDLADTLFEKDYYSYIEYANILIDDILDFIHTLPHAPYANLKRTDIESDDLKLVARALLPENIGEGSKLKYEFLQYELIG